MKNRLTSKKPCLVLTTVGKKTDANRIADHLVQEKLAACVSILPPMESRYRWQGKICREKEFLLIIKTLGGAYSELAATLAKLHPYDCPEILAFPAEQAWGPYEKWLQENVILPR